MVYPVLTIDRHCDPQVEVFEHLDKAHEYAERVAKQSIRHGEEVSVQIVSGYGTVYTYSCENDRCVVLTGRPRWTQDYFKAVKKGNQVKKVKPISIGVDALAKDMGELVEVSIKTSSCTYSFQARIINMVLRDDHTTLNTIELRKK